MSIQGAQSDRRVVSDTGDLHKPLHVLIELLGPVHEHPIDAHGEGEALLQHLVKVELCHVVHEAQEGVSLDILPDFIVLFHRRNHRLLSVGVSITGKGRFISGNTVIGEVLYDAYLDPAGVTGQAREFDCEKFAVIQCLGRLRH